PKILYWARAQRRETTRPAGRAGREIRTGPQPSDRPNARPRNSADAARPRRRGDRMKRRQFITLLGGGAAWPLTAWAQQRQGMRRIGVLMAHAENDAEFHDYLSAFREGLQKLGWTEGRNIQIDARWGARGLF